MKMEDDIIMKTRRYSDSSYITDSAAEDHRKTTTSCYNKQLDLHSIARVELVRLNSLRDNLATMRHNCTEQDNKSTAIIKSNIQFKQRVTCVINRRLRNYQHLFNYSDSNDLLNSNNRIVTKSQLSSSSLLVTTNMKPIKFIKSSLLLTIVIISSVILASLALAAASPSSAATAAVEVKNPSSKQSVKQVSSSVEEAKKINYEAPSLSHTSNLETPSAASDSLSAKKASETQQEEVPSGTNKGTETDSSNSEKSSRQSRAVDSSTASTAVNSSAESSADKKATNSGSNKKETSSTESANSNESNKSSSTNNKSSPNKSSSSTSSKSSSKSNNGGANPSHYISKYDSYSAIAEKHLQSNHHSIHDAMKKSDKRHLTSASMEHSSKLGDMLSSLKDVTNSGFSRSIGASVRSILKSKYSVPAYVASALLGAVALMAFYESPISPLPVPSLPEPPIGRFPPEMPSLPPNTQVPFRYGNNQQRQEQYNNNNNAFQRSFQQQQPNANGAKPAFFTNPTSQSTFGGAGVSFPGQTNTAQHGQQQLHQSDVAQRKSSLEYEPVVSSRSLFGGNSAKSNTLNSRIGTVGANQPHLDLGFDNMFNSMSYASHNGLAVPSEAKATNGQGDVLSNSHLINKFKSYFTRSSPASPSSSSSSSSSSTSGSPPKSTNPFEQYQKMSLIQALIKDTSFFPAFMSGNANKISSPSSLAASSSAASNNGQNKVKNQGGNTLSERMITTSNTHNSNGAQFNYAPESMQYSPNKPQASSGIMKAADKIAHALLETLTTGLQRHSPSASSSSSGSSSSVASAKSVNGHQDQMNSRKSPSSDSDLSSIETNASSSSGSSSNSGLSNNQSKTSVDVGSSSSSQLDSAPLEHGQSANSRSDESSSDSSIVSFKQTTSDSKSQQQSQQQLSANTHSSPSLSSNSLSRKTRSLDQQQHTNDDSHPQKPSTAANINHVIDYVSDSYAQNRLLFSTILHQVGLGHATHYMDSLLIGNSNVH